MLRQEGPAPAESGGMVAPGVSVEEMAQMMRYGENYTVVVKAMVLVGVVLCFRKLI